MLAFDEQAVAAANGVGGTETVITQDAYGQGPVRRSITSLRGAVRSGNSGGPMVEVAVLLAIVVHELVARDADQPRADRCPSDGADRLEGPMGVPAHRP